MKPDGCGLTVVGDDAQSIYSFRSAEVRNILDFPKHFRGAKVVKLQRNYRSTNAVLNVANAVLSASTARRHPKRLICTQGEGEKVQLVSAGDGDAEAQFVAQEIQSLVDRGEARLRDIAVLYRSNKQAPEIETALKMQGIAYDLIGSKQMFEKKEIKDLLAYLRVALEPFDELAVRRTLNYPARGIGEIGLSKIANHATAKDRSLYGSLLRAHEIPDLSAAARHGCSEYVRIITAMKNGIAADRPSLEIMQALIEAIDLKSCVAAESGSNNKLAARRWGNVQYLLRSFERHDERGTATLAEMLQRLLLRDDDRDKSDDHVADVVTLATIHGAKGLEYSVVFVVGLEDGLIPHQRVLDERVTDVAATSQLNIDELEQERRLLYVAITRAKKHLYLCHAKSRIMRGGAKPRALSRFLQKLPEELFAMRDLQVVSPLSATQTKVGADAVLAALLGD
jgi:DNA helicase-2/ATP-dependent DNA helicase PcrA